MYARKAEAFINTFYAIRIKRYTSIKALWLVCAFVNQ